MINSALGVRESTYHLPYYIVPLSYISYSFIVNFILPTFYLIIRFLLQVVDVIADLTYLLLNYNLY